MANKEHFKQEEIPYGILAKFGLTQEMIEDLPQNVIHRLLSSRTTPVLPIVTENIDGETILSYARISLIRLDDGSVDVYFIPKWVDEDLKEFSIATSIIFILTGTIRVPTMTRPTPLLMITPSGRA